MGEKIVYGDINDLRGPLQQTNSVPVTAGLLPAQVRVGAPVKDALQESEPVDALSELTNRIARLEKALGLSESSPSSLVEPAAATPQVEPVMAGRNAKPHSIA